LGFLRERKNLTVWLDRSCQFEAARVKSEDSDVKEVANYVRAMNHGLKHLHELPLSLRLVREMHAKLLEGVRGQEQTPEEFRRSQNWVGPAGTPLDHVRAATAL